MADRPRKTFKDSQEAGFRRMVRSAIRKADLTKSERDVTLAMVNHWFHHKSSGKPFIHPSREQIAKKADVSVRTVCTTIGILRKAGALVPLSGTQGGQGRATQYSVDVHALMALCGCGWGDEFLRGAARGVEAKSTPKPGHCEAKIARQTQAKIAHCLNDVSSHLGQEVETTNVLTFKPTRSPCPDGVKGLGQKFKTNVSPILGPVSSSEEVCHAS